MPAYGRRHRDRPATVRQFGVDRQRVKDAEGRPLFAPQHAYSPGLIWAFAISHRSYIFNFWEAVVVANCFIKTSPDRPVTRAPD